MRRSTLTVEDLRAAPTRSRTIRRSWNRQGPDVGPTYRSTIFIRNEAQRTAATAYVAELTKAGVYRRPIVTTLEPLVKFYEAEAYHQNYLALHLTQPYIVYNDLPKLEVLKRRMPEIYVAQ